MYAIFSNLFAWKCMDGHDFAIFQHGKLPLASGKNMYVTVLVDSNQNKVIQSLEQRPLLLCLCI